jgi:3-deoxy-7-phosphoheptulonate synthase
VHLLLDTYPDTTPQQPDWEDRAELDRVRAELGTRPALVNARDVYRLRRLLARVAAGEAQIIQAGDCAEDPAECTRHHVVRKMGLLDTLAGILAMRTRRPVIRVGRIAGQFAKPRSCPVERIGDRELPAYRGHLVNRPEPTPELRRPDPWNLLHGYDAAREAMTHLGWSGSRPAIASPEVWTSHEALLLDYEIPLLRHDWYGRPLLGSTHWPWVGDRTRQVTGTHVGLLAAVTNPVACKIGASISPDELVLLCRRLDPNREPGRLTLIARMGATMVAHELPPLVAAVRRAGHPVIWLSDPLHGNTEIGPTGRKIRRLSAILREVRDFQEAVRAENGIAGGLHLEATPENVSECLSDVGPAEPTSDRYTTLCDPRLNPGQAITVVSAWQPA